LVVAAVLAGILINVHPGRHVVAAGDAAGVVDAAVVSPEY
jgi:hypothetical protein